MGVKLLKKILNTSIGVDETCGGANYRSEKVAGDKSGTYSVIKECKEEGTFGIKATDTVVWFE